MTVALGLAAGWIVCGFIAATIHQATMDATRDRGAPFTYFFLGYLGLLAAIVERRNRVPKRHRKGMHR